MIAPHQRSVYELELARAHRFEIVGDVRDLPGMGEQLNDEFQTAVTARQ